MRSIQSIFKAAVPIILVLSSLIPAFSQMKNNYPDTDGSLTVGIKEYVCLNGTSTLLVFNPAEHPLHFYAGGSYIVQWIKNGAPLSNVIWQNNACGGFFQVTVTEMFSGKQGMTFIYLPDCLTPQVNTIPLIKGKV